MKIVVGVSHHPLCAFSLRGDGTSDHLRVRVQRKRGKFTAISAVEYRADGEDEDVHIFLAKGWKSEIETICDPTEFR